MQWCNWHQDLLELLKRWQSERQRVWRKMLDPWLKMLDPWRKMSDLWRKMSDLWRRTSPRPRPLLSGPSARPREARSGRCRRRSSRPRRATTERTRLRLQWRHQVTVFVAAALNPVSTTNSSNFRAANASSWSLKSTFQRHHKHIYLKCDASTQ